MTNNDFLKALGIGSQEMQAAALNNSKSAKNFTYDQPKGTRKHYESSTYVTPDGREVYGEWYDKNVGKKKYYSHDIYNDSDNKPFICKNKGTFTVEQIVIETYHGRKPDDGKDWVIFHKDGDIRNNAADNLEWKERNQAYPNTYKATTATHVKVGALMVFKDGRIKQGRKELSQHSCIGDSDVDMIIPITPYVEIYYINQWKRGGYMKYHIDKLMDAAGYVDGDKNHFNNPVILHRDNNWLNFKSENLEWVDSSDPRYLTYRKQATIDEDNYGIELNGEKKWRQYRKKPVV